MRSMPFLWRGDAGSGLAGSHEGSVEVRARPGFLRIHHITARGRPKGYLWMVSTLLLQMYQGDGDHDGLWDLLYAAVDLCLTAGILGDALLHFGASDASFEEETGPGAGVFADLYTREEDIVDEDPPVPTKIYVAEPSLRCENSFLALTRPVPEPERRMVTKEQAYVRRQRAERRKKKIVRKRERLQYAMRYLGANSRRTWPSSRSWTPSSRT